MLDARRQIEKIIFTYAEALDNGELGRVAALFSRGRIRVEGQPGSVDGEAAVRQMFERYTRFYDDRGKEIDPSQQPGKPFTRHITSNLYYDQLDDGAAVVNSCFTVMQALPGRKFEPVISGRYRDSFACEEGEWFLVERYEFMDLFGDLSAHLKMEVDGNAGQ